ncbi:hypothetical protein CSKR_100464 [Clonorchis sinensis]|uniref:Uncharacterized protein n=1 Tax=Clonorchis sinensis TaxID=79923 RepID=A0A419Q973_CLOSI|nr:hypothetical protein CSKR_100464 [Clonorchis sinensis]
MDISHVCAVSFFLDCLIECLESSADTTKSIVHPFPTNSQKGGYPIRLPNTTHYSKTEDSSETHDSFLSKHDSHTNESIYRNPIPPSLDSVATGTDPFLCILSDIVSVQDICMADIKRLYHKEFYEDISHVRPIPANRSPQSLVIS